MLAADSQRTEGGLRDSIPKLFITPAGILWGTAGTIAITQELFTLMRELDLPAGLPRQPTRDAIVKALRDAVRQATASMDDPPAAASLVDGLFAWYSKQDQREYLLRALGTGYAEFAPRHTAVGGPRDLARFAFSSSEHLDYATLPLEAGKMVALNIAENAIRASSSGVALPVQLGVVAATGLSIVDDAELRALEDTVAAFRENQRNFLIRTDRDEGAQPDTPFLSTSGETLTIEESMTLRARTENAGHAGDEHDGVYAAVASKGGAPQHPAWYRNFVEHPLVELQDEGAKGDYTAREVSGQERATWWERALAVWPDYADYQTKTDREIPVFVLEPAD